MGGRTTSFWSAAIAAGLFVALGGVRTCALAQAQEDSTESLPRAFQGQDDTEFPQFEDAPADAPTARLRIVFDLVSQSTELAVEPMVPFDAYVIAHDVQVALRGWEASLDIDSRLRVLERNITSNVQIGEPPDVIAALKPRDCLSGNTVVLAHLRLMLTEPDQNDVTLGLGPASHPTPITVETDLEGPLPVYLVCRPEKDVRPFDYCRTCAVVNPETVHPDADASSRRPIDDLLKPVRGRASGDGRR